MKREELRAALLTAFSVQKPKGRGRPPRVSGEDFQFQLALKIERRALELGGGRGAQAQAIRELMRVKDKHNLQAKQRGIERGKKAVQRHKKTPVPSLARFEYALKVMPQEIRRRLRNVPENKMRLFDKLPMGQLLGILRIHSIDGDFPLEVLETLEGDFLSPK